MNCRFCKTKCQKAGLQKNGTQKLYCRSCDKCSQVTYRYTACRLDSPVMIRGLVSEGVGIRSIGRLLQIGINPVVRRIVKLADSIVAPKLELNAAWEIDELWA
jgi:transposase-like protein